MNTGNQSAQPAAWNALRRYTPARVAIGRAGGSAPTSAVLDFRLAHARARDALTRPLDEEGLAHELRNVSAREVFRLSSLARTSEEYLLRPDLGRQLAPESIEMLRPLVATSPDLVVLISEGLSTSAVETHAANVLRELLPLLTRDAWRLAPVCLVRRARVAVQDHAGEILGARLALILLGERPGLVSPDSLGAYLVHGPRVGNTDAQRNCVSNISAHGITPAQAAAKLHWLLSQARTRQISGVTLKDEFDPAKQLSDRSR
ncbi:MAG TPA: ethanolamine ammonia-lyase subunit EutC [Candidatus Acidoferrum sp.]|nr:ethanolamine ammonia-lyase subunit EutC [Candidatus Acidoferrum sp.]